MPHSRKASTRQRARCSNFGNPTATGCLSWRPTALSRPNICCCATFSASRSTRCWKPRSPTIAAAVKPRARNPKGVGVDELFLQDPRSIGMTAKAPHQSRLWFTLFRSLDVVLRTIEPLVPDKLRRRAIDKAVAFVEDRLNGEDGVG